MEMRMGYLILGLKINVILLLVISIIFCIYIVIICINWICLFGIYGLLFWILGEEVNNIFDILIY